jgi:hypothetical protein
MKRQFPGLQLESREGEGLLEGTFLVRVDRACYCGHPQKPFFVLRFKVIEPKKHLDRLIAGRLYCNAKALWKLNSFLREFGYDSDLLGRDEVDERSLLGLVGIIKTARVALHGRSFLNLKSFAPAAEWEELSCANSAKRNGPESGHDL